MDRTRRSALRLSGLALGSVFTGCVASDSPDEGSKSPSPTSPPDEAAPPAPNLSFSAEVLRQASADAPARVKASLSNDGSADVAVSFGPTLLFTDNGASDDLEWADDLVIDPETYIGPWADPERTDDGCWRFPSDGDRLVQSSDVKRELSPGESLRETYEVYTHGDALPCLPEGTYRFQDEGNAGQKSWSMVLTLLLDVAADKRLTATADGPDFSPTEPE